MVFKPGLNMGPARLSFGIATDSPEFPSIELVLKASLVPEWQVVERPGNSTEVPVGQAAVRRLRVFHRSHRVSPKTFPDKINGPDSIRVRFAGDPATSSTDDVIETGRDVEIDMPASAEAGDRRVEVAFSNGAGDKYPVNLFWRVVPLITASPNGFVLSPSPGPVERSVVVRSIHGEEFAILDIAAPRRMSLNCGSTRERSPATSRKTS